MKHTPLIPKTLNLTLASVLMLAIMGQLLLLPLLARNGGWPAWVMPTLIVAMIPLNTPLWSLIHEAIHRNMHPERTSNEAWGRVMAVIFGASFHLLRFGHLMHHQYNRHWESEIYRPPQKKWLVTCNHYFKMSGGIYWTEVLLTFLLAITPSRLTQKIAHFAFADEHQRAAITRLIQNPSQMARLRFDCAMIALLYGTSFAVYGAAWPLLLLLLGGRAFMISFMDNAYHYNTPPDNSVAAWELQAPHWLARMILNFNFHLTHHKNAHLPWNALAQAHGAQGHAFDDSLWRAMLAQCQGPIDVRQFEHKAPPPHE